MITARIEMTTMTTKTSKATMLSISTPTTKRMKDNKILMEFPSLCKTKLKAALKTAVRQRKNKSD